MTIDEPTAVAQANEGFYRAFESLDIDRMRQVWLDDDAIQCTHPGWGLLRGRDAVMTSWRQIFEHTGEIRFVLTEVKSEIRDGFAWVTLYENIRSKVEGGTVAAVVATTNIFEKRAQGWLLIHHHGSTVAQPMARSDSTTVH